MKAMSDADKRYYAMRLFLIVGVFGVIALFAGSWAH